MTRAALAVAGLVALLLTGCKNDPSTPEYWDKAFQSAKKAKDRARVVENLREAKVLGPAFAPMLVEKLKADKSSEVKAALARAIGEIKDPTAVPALIESLDFGTPDAAGNAMNKALTAALADIGDPKAVPTLVKLLKVRDNYTRLEAISALGALRAPEAVDGLLEVALDDAGEPFVSGKAVVALGNIGDPKAVPALVKMMFKERRGVTFYGEASFALFQIGAPAAPALLAVLKGEDKAMAAWAKENKVIEPALLSKTAQVLGDLYDEKSVPTLIQRLAYSHEEPDKRLYVRMMAASALGRIRAKDALKALGGVVDEEEPTARRIYTQALISMGSRDALPFLVKAASKGDWYARQPAMEAVAMLGDEREVKQLEKWIKDEPGITAKECAEAECKDAQAEAKSRVDGLEKLRKVLDTAGSCKDAACWGKKLSDPEEFVRQRAALELGRTDSAAAMGDLLGALKEPSPEVRSAVLQSASWLVHRHKEAAAKAKAAIPAMEAQRDAEKGKSAFALVNEDLKRLIAAAQRG